MDLIHVSAGSIFAIGVGIAGVFFGFKFFRIFLALFGFMIGYLLGGWVLGLVNITDSTVLLIGGLVGGVILAILAYRLYHVAVTIFGGILGMTIGIIALSFFDASQIVALIVVAVGALVGALLSTRLADTIIILSTAITGATQAVYGFALLIPSLPLGEPSMRGGTDSIISLGILAVLAGAGIYFQMKQHRG